MQMAAALSGFYVLTKDGELVFHDEQGRRVIDVRLTHAFRRHNAQLLQAYLADPEAQGEGGPLRVGLICRPPAKTRWNSDTLIIETPVLRSLYSNKELRPDAELTEFQKRSREQSVFRGMELLLEFRKEALPGVPIYCPVLFDRGTFLGEYDSAPDWGNTSEGFRVRVLEVLNLIATIPASHRTSAAVECLRRSIHNRVIRKDRRGPSRFAVITDGGLNSAAHQTAVYPRYDVPTSRPNDSREQAAVMPAVAAGWTERGTRRSHSAARLGVQKIARSIEPPILRAFARLADLADEDLALLAAEARLYTAPAGTQLLKQGARDKGAFYLLHGQVKLEALDGKTQCIQAGTTAAQQPVAHLKPRMYTVTAETAVTFLWIPDALLTSVLDRYPLPGEIQVHFGLGRFSGFAALVA